MIRRVLPLAALLPILTAAADTPAIQPGGWDVKSTAVDLTVPGAPGFLLRMMRGKSKTEHKCLAPQAAAQGIAALLVPDPKARCTVESTKIADGRFAQVIGCPQKDGRVMRLVRSGTYDATGFTARATMSGQTPKGPLNIVLDQTARRAGPACRKA